jgi:hypothetical protein
MTCVACGCGRVGFDTSAPAGDGSVPGGGDASAPGDGLPTSDGTVGTGACGANLLLFDDFEDGIQAAEWSLVAGTGLTVAETGGFLQITFASNVPAGQQAGYITAAKMDFTGTCVEAEVVMTPSAAANGEMRVLMGSGQNIVTIYENGGMLQATEQLGAAVDRMPAMTFDPVAHRWWRLRNTAGTWYFEVASDAVTYTIVYSVPQNFPLQTATTLELIALSGSATGNGGVVQFGSVRVSGP